MQSCQSTSGLESGRFESKGRSCQGNLGDFERGARNLRIETMQKVVTVLENEGIRFEGEGGRILVELNPKN